jgi:hypothetical protein
VTPEPTITFSREVDRALAGVAASPRRKREMREELLAHLVGAYEQEVERVGESEAAARAAVGRFGADESLARELERSVPWYERVLWLVLHAKEHRMSRFVWPLGLAAVAIGMSVMLPALAALRHKWPEAAVHGVLLAVGAMVVLAGLAMFAYGIAVRRSKRVA